MFYPTLRARPTPCAAVIALLVLALPDVVRASWHVRVWPVGEATKHEAITDLGQGQDGYLWLATRSGLTRFDGLEFDQQVPVLTQDSGPALSRTVFCNDGAESWTVVESGHAVLRRPGRDPTIIGGLPKATVRSVVQDGEGVLWISYRDAGLWRVCHGRAEGCPLPADAALASEPDLNLAIDIEGTLWFAGSGVVGRRSQGKFEVLHQVRPLLTRIAAARSGGVWVFQGLNLFRCAGPSVPSIVGKVVSRDRTTIASVLLEDREGAVWIGTVASGLFRYCNGTFETVPTPYRAVTSLFEDRDGDIWVGTADEGLSRVRRQTIELETPDRTQPFQTLQSVCEDAQGRLWGTTRHGQLLCREEGMWRGATHAAGWPAGLATCVAADPNGHVWIGTASSRLHRWDGQAFSTLDRRDGIPHTTRGLLASSAGDLWIFGLADVRVLRGKTHALDVLAWPAEGLRFSAACEDQNGRIWIGTATSGLFTVDRESRIVAASGMPAGTRPVQTLATTPDGAVWIAYPDRLGRLHNGMFASIGTEQGLADGAITQIVADGRGWLWLGSPRGIFRVRQAELNAVMDGLSERVQSIVHSPEDGIPSARGDEGCASRAVRTRDGRLLIPTRDGLAIIHPEKVRDTSVLPIVRLSRMLVDEGTAGDSTVQITASFDVPGSPRDQPPPPALSPRHHHLRFEFTALDLSAPENVQFQYRLDGLDEGWKEAGSRRSASYSRLAAGRYRFRVRARGSNGVWSPDEAAMAFSVAPFFWQSWWFLAGTLGAFGISLVGAGRYFFLRRLRARVQALEQRAGVEKERARIAKDLHDDLGGSLTHAALLLNLSRQDRLDPEKIESHLDRMATALNQITGSVDEIVWAANPRNDTLAHLVSYVSFFASDFLQTAGLRCRIDAPSILDDRAISPEVRHNLFLVVKEALTNVVRHAGATEVSLRVDVTDAQLTLVVSDDGRGFSESANTSSEAGNGLLNIRQRMHQLGGQCHIESEPGAGTRIIAIHRWPARPAA